MIFKQLQQMTNVGSFYSIESINKCLIVQDAIDASKILTTIYNVIIMPVDLQNHEI